MIHYLGYVLPAKWAGLTVIRAAAGLGWIRYSYDVADHMPAADAGFELLDELCR
jgi:hypothetical protein